MKKIVLSQTCQGEILKQLLALSQPFQEEYTCHFVPNYEIKNGKAATAAVPTALEAELPDCDVLVYHAITLYDFDRLIALMPPGSQAFRIPYVTSTIYWPSLDFQNPCWLGPRQSTALIPWPCRVLNELIVRRREKQRVIQNYLETDLAASFDLSTHFSNQVTYLEQAEAGTIFHIADRVQREFASVQLFHMINHPSVVMFLDIADALLETLGFPKLPPYSYDPFCMHQMPIHPSVIRHYKLTWCGPDTRWVILDKKFDFEEYTAYYIDAYIEKFGYAQMPTQARSCKVHFLQALRQRWRCGPFRRLKKS